MPGNKNPLKNSVFQRSSRREELAKASKIAKWRKQPKYKVRQHNRCRLCGRPRAYYRMFGLCRICFRKLALEGHLPGVRKSSW